jgi:hypothetical protein
MSYSRVRRLAARGASSPTRGQGVLTLTVQCAWLRDQLGGRGADEAPLSYSELSAAPHEFPLLRSEAPLNPKANRDRRMPTISKQGWLALIQHPRCMVLWPTGMACIRWSVAVLQWASRRPRGAHTLWSEEPSDPKASRERRTPIMIETQYSGDAGCHPFRTLALAWYGGQWG